MINAMLDVDDVLFPLARGLHRKAHEMGLHDNTIEALRVWHGWKQYGCTVDQWHDVFEALHQEDYYLQAEPIEDTLEPLRELYFDGIARINLVTARGFMGRADDIRRWTAEWVGDFAVPHHTLTFAKDKVGAQAELGRFDAALDDGTHNFVALKRDGVDATLLTVPHNEDDDVPARCRVNSVREWCDKVRRVYTERAA